MWLLISNTPCMSLHLLHQTFHFYFSFEVVPEDWLFFPSSHTSDETEVLTLSSVMCNFLGACVCEYSLEFMEKTNSIMMYFLLFITFFQQPRNHSLYSSYFGKNVFPEFWHRITTLLWVKDKNNHLTEDLSFEMHGTKVRIDNSFCFHCYFLMFQKDLNKPDKQTKNSFTQKGFQIS